MVMDDKTEAKIHRNAADLFDKIAKVIKPVNAYTAQKYRDEAQVNRDLANELDPPRPEWQDGDLALDNQGDLWQFSCRRWYLQSLVLSTEELTRNYGPLTRVLTYDPAKQQVVVSLDGLDREELDKWAAEEERRFAVSSQKIAIRTAKAAREQLGEVQ